MAKRGNSKADNSPKPMDPSVQETDNLVVTHEPRTCWAIRTLVTEIHDVFPEIPVEYSEVDGRNTALAVTFDLTVLDTADRALANSLLDLLDADNRISNIIEEDDRVLVSMWSNPRTQDDKSPFGIADAHEVLTEEAQ